MKKILVLTKALLKTIVRNRSSFFWSLAFPLIFIAVFGWMAQGNAMSIRVGIISRDDGKVTQIITDVFEDSPGITVINIDDNGNSNEVLNELIKDDEIDAGVVIPNGLTDVLFKNYCAGQCESTTDASSSINNGEISNDQVWVTAIVNGIEEQLEIGGEDTVKVLIYVPSNDMISGVVLKGVIDGTLHSIVRTSNNIPQLYNVLLDNDIDGVSYFDFLFSGLIGMGLMNAAIVGTAITVTQYKDKKIFKRLILTSVGKVHFYFARILSLLIIAILQTIILLAVGVFAFNVSIRGNIFLLLGVVAIGLVSFINIGFIIGGISKNSNASKGLAMLVNLPMMFLGGTFFPSKNYPDWLQKVVQVLPLTHINNVVRQIMIYGDNLVDVLPILWPLLAIVLVTAVLGIILFKWDVE